MTQNNSIDFIGDIHGHADELKALLQKLGYSHRNSTWKHPERIAFFVGDYIDRGPKIPETLDIVRRMTDAGSAKALMGNHEYNAICYHQQDEDGGHLREHSEKNTDQHRETLTQFRGRQSEYDDYITWFKSLPLFYESETFRAVHATWDQNKIDVLKNRLPQDRLTDDLLYTSAQKESDLYNAVDVTLKGKEVKLPDGMSIKDRQGHERTEVRIKWWDHPEKHTWKTLIVGQMDTLPDKPVAPSALPSSSPYRENELPVFFGHYWLRGNPSLYRSNVCCLDYSVAKQGKLVAYRFDGEKRLTNEKLVFV
ncbi:MAG: phosphoesterase [Balneolaceae bacterium]|nr:MAG: phosphoesterase [Balneolaceae bacterium]